MLISKEEFRTLRIVLFIAFIAWLFTMVIYFDNPMVNDMFSSRFAGLFIILWVAVYCGYVAGRQSMEKSLDKVFEENETKRKASVYDRLATLVTKKKDAEKKLLEAVERKKQNGEW